ncbi:hypothetical protein ACYOEI_08695, partial [Singulisphaera rosea]
PRVVEVAKPTIEELTPSLSVVKPVAAPRLFIPSQSDRQWWAEHSPTRNELYNVVGRCAVVVEPEVSDFHAWLEDGCPDPEPELTPAGTWA